MLAVARAMTSRYRSWISATDIRQSQRAAWARLFEQYDVVLAPVMPTAAFPHDTDRPMTERLIDVDGVAVSHFQAAAWCGAIGAMLLPVVTLPTDTAGTLLIFKTYPQVSYALIVGDTVPIQVGDQVRSP